MPDILFMFLFQIRLSVCECHRGKVINGKLFCFNDGAVSLSWLFLLVFYTATSTHSFTSLTHLPNSRGEVCGEGAKNKERENLLYFDISKCAGLRADNETCRTKQVRISSAEVTIFNYLSPDMCY